ncbi:MAG TPA: hypothetical protein VFG42_11325 [Baekduia sp.]|uniref:hypothetical protein n=1 Tax=Baekduia sp. TaxID=2600305 RepID=UPI002D792326|nr:hypothetical protein [Baekduia sp.]HET6507368.1 hypothetical protein [Baekduia sp.]
MVVAVFIAGRVSAGPVLPQQPALAAPLIKHGPAASLTVRNVADGKAYLIARGNQLRDDPTRFNGSLTVKRLPTKGNYVVEVRVASAKKGGAPYVLRYDAAIVPAS